MEISRQNYEQYFVDYLDGKLNDEQAGDLMSFLEFNPDIKEEFADIEKMCLAPDETKFSGKANLLKSESDLSEAAILKDFDMYCISSMENDIAGGDEEILQGIIRDDPDRENTYMLYRSTRLLPDESVLYPGKVKLKKRFINISYRIMLPAAAAVAALLIILQVYTGKGPEVYNVTQSFQSPENSNDNKEISSPHTETTQPPAETSLLTREERSTGISPVNDGQAPGKGSHMPDGYITEAELNTSRETIQLARIASKSIPQLKGSNVNYEEITPTNLTLRQTTRLPENGDSAEISGDNHKLSLWMLADASIRGLNSVSEDEYYLDREKDKNGKTRRITFDSLVFGISSPLRKPDK